MSSTCTRRPPRCQAIPQLFVIHAHRESKVANGEFWHSDVSCDEVPPLGTMLQIHLLPEIGGDTLFANMDGLPAYDALSAPMPADASRADGEARVRARLPQPVLESRRGRAGQNLSAGEPSRHPDASGNRAESDLRQPHVHDADQRAERSGRAARCSTCCSITASRLTSRSGSGGSAPRRGVLGQPLCDAPCHLGLLAERAQGTARDHQRRSPALRPTTLSLSGLARYPAVRILGCLSAGLALGFFFPRNPVVLAVAQSGTWFPKTIVTFATAIIFILMSAALAKTILTHRRSGRFLFYVISLYVLDGVRVGRVQHRRGSPLSRACR